jgi:hypothetical protein
MAKAQQPHLKATYKDLKLRVAQDQRLRVHGTSAHQILFEKTLSLYRTYRSYGCLAPADSCIVQSSTQDDPWIIQNERSRRGHDSKFTCNGQLIFDYDLTGKAFVR